MNRRTVVSGYHSPIKYIVEDVLVRRDRVVNERPAHTYPQGWGWQCHHMINDGTLTEEVLETQFVGVEPWTDKELHALRPFTFHETHPKATCEFCNA